MRRLSLLIIFPLLFLVTSCEKDKNTEPEVVTDINITSPTGTLIYVNGGIMKIEGTMADNNVLSSAKVEVRNKANGNILFQASSPTGNVGFYMFLWNWTISGITSPITATVKVIAIDKLSNEVSEEVDVQIDL